MVVEIIGIQFQSSLSVIANSSVCDLSTLLYGSLQLITATKLEAPPARDQLAYNPGPQARDSACGRWGGGPNKRGR